LSAFVEKKKAILSVFREIFPYFFEIAFIKRGKRERLKVFSGKNLIFRVFLL